MEAPLPIRLDQHRRDDEGPLGSYPAHPISQTVDSKMGRIRGRTLYGDDWTGDVGEFEKIDFISLLITA